MVTTKISGGWAIKGVPLVIARSPYAPKWGEKQEWIICAAEPSDRVLAGGYLSKAHALEALEAIANALIP